MKDPFKTHGAFSWNELMTSDPAAAKDFYQKLLGWDMEDMNMENMTYTVVKAGGDGIGGIMGLPPEASGAPPHWGSYITVDNVDETAQSAETLGGKIMMAPRDIPGVGRFAVIQDPQGAFISLITYSMEQ
jgi:predicted enzyme related to lactoylglutathione lyase